MTNSNTSESRKRGALSGAARRIFKSLQHLLFAQTKFGCSKHRAKQAARDKYLAEHGSLRGYNPAKVDGIYSCSTLRTYLNWMRRFALYCVEYYGAKRISDLTERMGEQYLIHLHSRKLSSWTIYTAASAINKATGWTLSPRRLGIPKRMKANIKQNRTPRTYNAAIIAANSDQMLIARASGIRRMSMTQIRPIDCVRDSTTGTVIGIMVKEKGGKRRIAPILLVHQKAISDIVNRALIQNGETAPIFTRYSTRINTHHLRAEYAAQLLLQLEAEYAAGRPLFGGAFELRDYCHLRGKDKQRRAKTAGHETVLLACCSGALGHNRVSVILGHYLHCY